MTTKYPNQIDGIEQLPIIVDLQSEVVAAVPNAQRSAIIAIEQELGVKPSGTFGSVKDRLNSIDSTISDLPLISLSGDFGGSLSNPLVIGLQGVPISDETPLDGYSLVFDGIQWAPQLISGGGGSVDPATTTEFGTIKLAGDISGTATAITVTKIQNINILSGTPDDGDLLTYSTADSRWEPRAAGGGIPDPFAGLGCTTELRVDEGVEHGVSVSKWIDQRGYRHFIPFMRDANLFQGTVLPASYIADYGDGFPAIYFNSTPEVKRLMSFSPIITSGIFSIALRIYVPASDGSTLLTCTPTFPGFDSVPTTLEIATGTQSGGNIPIRFNLTDDDATNVEADMDVTKDAWHTLIFRTDATRMLIRSDGVNGVTADTTAFATFETFDTSGLACLVAPDGSQNGFATNMSIRHILIADGTTWTDEQCVTIETEFTNLWT